MIIACFLIAFTALFALGKSAAAGHPEKLVILAQAGPDNQPFRVGFDLVPGSVKISESVWFSPNKITNVTHSTAGKLVARNDHCEDMCEIHPEVTLGSPLTDDCQVIYDRIVGPGTWTVLMWVQHQLIEYNSCAFGVTAFTSSSGTAIFAHIGNDDIREVLKRSMDEYSRVDSSHRRRVQSWGQFLCGPFDAVVEWGIYHQKGWTEDN
ncbi:putative necrosis-inducing factor-domain-containing protein [Apiosordaria backusii]|uniref:Necrosis-inducing factor-domain-containing protein n=1 Tax=Apiosordaria backusii TaxID=314023 RepID=A0AA40E327_9PEZI|nr:putative necrosis-inducing factor-domain-containing protein [Apiosordaria backusii]